MKTMMAGPWRPRRIARLALALAAGLGMLGGHALLNRARAADGWALRVVASGLTRPDNMALAGERLLLTEERPGAEGRVLSIESGRSSTLLAGLNKPDGLLLAGGALYLTEEVPRGRVLQLDLAGGGLTELARLHNPEGIGLLPDGSLVVAEDARPGRLVLIGPTGGPRTLLAGLDRPEGLVVDPAGCVIYAETGSGGVSRWCGGEPERLVSNLRKPDQLALCADGSLWIGEDLGRGARLLRHHDGVTLVVASGLKGVQGIQCPPTGGVLVAEQARGRLLEVTRLASRAGAG